MARRVSAPRTGIIRALALPRRRRCPGPAGSCRAPPAARRPSESPRSCSHTRPRTPQPARLAASVLLARPSRHHSWRIAGRRAGRHYAATGGKFQIRSPATFRVAVGAAAAPARPAQVRWAARLLGRRLDPLYRRWAQLRVLLRPTAHSNCRGDPTLRSCYFDAAAPSYTSSARARRPRPRRLASRWTLAASRAALRRCVATPFSSRETREQRFWLWKGSILLRAACIPCIVARDLAQHSKGGRRSDLKVRTCVHP